MTDEVTKQPKHMKSGMIKKNKKKKRGRKILVKIWVNGVMISVVVLLGINAYLMWQKPIEPVAAIEKKKDVPSVEVLNTQGASKFARDFAAAWVQGNRDAIKNYLAIGFELPKDAWYDTTRKVVWAQEGNVTQVSQNRVNVQIKLGVEREIDGKTETQVVYLSVPLIVEADGRYGVCDLPTYLPEPGRATYKTEDVTASSLQPKDKDEIRKRIRFFLEQYLSGTPDSLAFLFEDQKQRAVLVGTLLAVPEIQIYQVSDDDQDKAKVKAIAQVEINEMKSMISFNVIMKKSGNQWFIESTDPSIPLYTVDEKNEKGADM